jgi:TrmH family RNA methyltransferase
MDQQKISSRDNPRLKHLKKLLHDRQYRYACGEYVIEGVRALDGVRSVKELFVADDVLLPAIAADRVYVVANDILRQIAATEASQGVMATRTFKLLGPDAIDAAARYVLLDRLQDPGNMGTIMRVACAFGIRGIIVTAGCVDPFAPKVVRAAAGAIGRIDVVEIKSIAQVKASAIIAADAGGEDLSRFVWPEHFILAVGNEANGLSDEIRSRAAGTVAISMPGGMESLNAAVAAGIILYSATVRMG